jgi:hypothetical protein
LYFSKFYCIFYEFLKFIQISRIINKIEKPERTVLGRTVAHGLPLQAQPSQKYSPQRDDGMITARGAHVVARCPAALWCSAGNEVPPVCTGGLR